MIIALIIVAIIVIVVVSNLPDDKAPNKHSPFEIAFIGQVGQDPVSYIKSKLSSGSDLGAIRYLFEIIEAEVEKKSKCKSPGFDFYYAKVSGKQANQSPAVQTHNTKPSGTTSSKESPRHRWTMEEDVLCCRRFFEQYVIQYSSMDAQFFAQQLHRELPDISVWFLKMKAQNIQQLCLEYGIKSRFKTNRL